MKPTDPAPEPIESRAPRVLFIATDLSTGGGVNKAIRDQAALLDGLGAEVCVVNARSDRKSTYPFLDSVKLEQGRSGSRLAYFRTLLRLRKSKPDFVVSSWTQDNILAVLAFAFSGARLILVEHTSWNFHSAPLRLLRTIVYPFAWRVIVLNPAEFEHYRPHLSNVRLIPNLVPEGGQPIDASREKLILAVGHLEPRKNFADAIRAMAHSGLEAQGWSLAIIGDGPQKPELEQLIASLGLKRTTIHPSTPDIALWYARSSLTLVTARLEVFSLVLAEAMLSGVVPIAYAADGPAFILQDFPENLVAMGDVNGLAQGLVRFASSRDLSQLRGNLRQSIADRFSPGVIAAEWSKLLAEARAC